MSDFDQLKRLTIVHTSLPACWSFDRCKVVTAEPDCSWPDNAAHELQCHQYANQLVQGRHLCKACILALLALLCCCRLIMLLALKDANGPASSSNLSASKCSVPVLAVQALTCQPLHQARQAAIKPCSCSYPRLPPSDVRYSNSAAGTHLPLL